MDDRTTSERPRLAPRRREMAALLGLVVVALLVRAARLTESLWYDEIATWYDYGTLGPAGIVTTYYDPANHVAHTLLSWWSYERLGSALGPEVALRVPALLFSLLSVLALYGLARRAGGPRVALLAAGLAAAAPVSVLEGVEARGYSMMIFGAAAATWALLAALDARRPALPVLLYALACALGIWAHLMTVFAPLGHAAWLAWRAARHRDLRAARRGAVALGLAAGLTLLVYAPILDDIEQARRRFAGADAGSHSPFGAEGWHALLQLGGSWYAWAALPGLALAVVGALRLRRDAPARRAASLALLGLPLMLAAVIVAGTWMYARFTLFALPGALLLVALGLDTLWSRRAELGAAALVVLVACFAGDLVVRPPKQPLRAAAAHVARHRGPDEQVLVIGLRHRVLGVYAEVLAPTYSLLHGADLAERLAASAPTWIVVTYPESVPPDRRALLAERGYETVARFRGWVDWTNGDVVVMRKE